MVIEVRGEKNPNYLKFSLVEFEKVYWLNRRYNCTPMGFRLPISELDLVLVWVEAKRFLGSIPEEERDFDRAKATFIRNN